MKNVKTLSAITALVACCAGLPLHADTPHPTAVAAAGAAAVDQQLAQSKLENLLTELRWHVQFADLKSRLIAQIAEQRRIIAEISHVQSQGKTPSELTCQESKFNADTSSSQGSLATALRGLTADMQKTASSIQATKPELAKALRAAAQVAADEHIGPHQETAAALIGANKPGQASTEAKPALAGLLAMKDILDRAEQYELTQLGLEARKLREELIVLRDMQAKAKTEAQAAGNKAELLRPLADRENRMNLNLLSLRERTAALPDGQKVEEDLREAQGDMQQAAGDLFNTHQPQAINDEAAVIASLNSAIDKLQTIIDNAPQEPSELAALRAKFVAARTREVELRDAVTGMELHRKTLGELPLVDRTSLDRMVSSQTKLADTLHALAMSDLGPFAEYAWITDQVAQMMRDSGEHMSHQETSVAVTGIQNGAITRLTTIIDALQEEELQKPTFLTPPGPDGSGPGGPPGDKPPLILPLAELKMLRALELLDIRETVALNQALEHAATDETRASLRARVEQLGLEQKKVGELAQQLVNRLAH